MGEIWEETKVPLLPKERGGPSGSNRADVEGGGPFDQQAYGCRAWANKVDRRASSIRIVPLVVLAILPVFAEPAWYTREVSKGHRHGPADYLLSGVPYLHGSTILLVEFLCALLLAGSLVLRLFSKNETSRAPWRRWIQMGLLVAVGFHLIASSLLLVNWTQQIEMYLCILVPIAFSRSLRDCFRMAIRIGTSILGTAVVLVGFLLMSAWLANELFDQPDFEDFSTSLLSLFVLLTTVNSPNVWAATFEENRLSFFFFFVYMVVAYFFLVEVLVTLVSKNYKDQLDESKELLSKSAAHQRSTGPSAFSIVKAAAPILGFQFCVCSLWSVAGVQLFGGKVFKGQAAVEETEYATSGLWVFNYNDHASAMVTAFNLCIVNNWHIFMDGYAAATESRWSRAYFIAFWCVEVTVVLKLLVGSLVGLFTTQRKGKGQRIAGPP